MNDLKRIRENVNNCLYCDKKTCLIGCPLDNNIPLMIKYIKENDFANAYNVLLNTTILPSVCGRICPYDKQCIGACIKDNIEIGYLESIVGDMAILNNYPIPLKDKINKKVLVIGGGPAGLTCAYFLRKEGIDVDIYEAHSYLGGLLFHGIPDFRLDKKVLEDTLKRITNLDIKIKYNMKLGKDFTIDEVIDSYDAIFIGIGANVNKKLGIDGESLVGVYGGNELLEYNLHSDYSNKVVCVNGGGNVAMDVSRTIKRLGAQKVYVIYRRNEKDMPADNKEIEEAKKDGIEFIYNTNVIKIIGNDNVNQIECIKTNIVDGIPTNIIGTNFNIDTNYFLEAIGSTTDINILQDLNIDLTDNNKIKVNKFHTNNNKIFAAGDVVNNKQTVAFAARTGKDAAYEILKYLKK